MASSWLLGQASSCYAMFVALVCLLKSLGFCFLHLSMQIFICLHEDISVLTRVSPAWP